VGLASGAPRRERQRKGDAGPAFAAVLGPDSAAVRMDEALRDREAQTGAAAGTSPGLVVAPEALEHPLWGLGRETVAVVLHRDDDMVGVGLDHHGHGSVRRRVANRVAATTNPGPIDLASSDDFLYAETGINGTVDEFHVASDGTLEPLGTVAGLPSGIEGIAAT
jgi:hypothetical protein